MFRIMLLITANDQAKVRKNGQVGWFLYFRLCCVPCYFFILQIWVQVDLVRVFSQLFIRSGLSSSFFQSPTVLRALLNHSSSPPEYALQTMGIVIFTHNLSSPMFCFWRRLFSSPIVITPRLLPKFLEWFSSVTHGTQQVNIVY